MSELSEPGRGPSLSDFYSGKNILITGATGFVGIAVVEKLLYEFPDIGKIYMLMRPKRGKAVSDRFTEIRSNSVFRRLLQEKGEKYIDELFSHLVPVAGNVESPGLDLSTKDEEMIIQNCNIIIHSAATLDFSDPLRRCVEVNLIGTQRVIGLAQKMLHLKVFVYISSAFANCFVHESAKENMYECQGLNNAELLRKIRTTPADKLEQPSVLNSVIGNHVNPYTYTKHAAEMELYSTDAWFPIVIVRPSMITTAWREPLPGWTISKNGPTGFLMGALIGVIRRVPINRDAICDYIPIDIVVNTIITSAWHEAYKKEKFKIFHCTTSHANPFHWRDVDSHIDEILHSYPVRSAVLYPSLKLVPGLKRFYLSAIRAHVIPGLFLDLIAYVLGPLLGMKPKCTKLHYNVLSSIYRLSPFIFNEWVFENQNHKQILSSMTKGEAERFPLDVTQLEWGEYLTDMVKGVRKFLMREEDTTLASAKKRDKYLFYINHIGLFTFYTSLIMIVGSCAGLQNMTSFFISVFFYVLHLLV